ncbi:hypothetical protein CNMCM8980_006963 [Aspergillus fumigatiaffinis]|uniref:CUE domain-containing protein n=1 Tax=Aspergillus fumigatiaffinis TaxID=340414 RepID=A0A8H4MA92_9EURO|nr:hypothetical protein CNMCM6805_006986 [Aspergillus fumigatiaffinis]KAF4247740.1 hypothetical protein CNMCM8980_006963 [Aspergillus fumigatiaffinis]
MAQKTIRKGKKVAGGRSRTDSCGEEAVGSNQLSNVAGDWSRIDSRGKEAVDSNQLSIVAGGRSRAVLRGKEAVGTNQLSIMEAFKRQRGPDCQGPSQRSVLQDDSSVSLIRDNRLQKAVPSGVSTRVNHVTPGPIDQGTSSLAGQEIRSVSGTKRCSSSSDDTEDINTERGSSASSLNPPTKRTKVQEADKRTTIVLPKRRGPVLKVNDDDDEEKPPGSGTSIPPRGRIPASKWYESSFTQDTPMLSRPSKKASPRRTDNGADIAMRERRDPVIMIGDDEEDGMDLSLKPTSRRRPGTLFLSATGRVGLATTAGSGMVSNDAVERNLRDLAARYPAYNVDSLCEVLRANGNGLSAAIRMLDGQTGLDIVEIEGIIDPCSTTCENITDIDGKLAGLVARFPTYEVELLKEILQGCGGNVDEAIAEIELPFSDESETFCEDDVQEHDEEIDQIDDETVNEEDSASIMGDKEVYDSDQEVEDDSEYTDAGEPALPDIEYTDSFERDFYSNFGISSNEVIELQTKFKSRLTAILSHIVHGIAECSFEDLESSSCRRIPEMNADNQAALVDCKSPALPPLVGFLTDSPRSVTLPYPHPGAVRPGITPKASSRTPTPAYSSGHRFYPDGEVWVARLSAVHFQGEFIRPVSCYTLLSGFRLPWPPSGRLDELTPFVVSDERAFRYSVNRPHVDISLPQRLSD